MLPIVYPNAKYLLAFSLTNALGTVEARVSLNLKYADVPGLGRFWLNWVDMRYPQNPRFSAGLVTSMDINSFDKETQAAVKARLLANGFTTFTAAMPKHFGWVGQAGEGVVAQQAYQEDMAKAPSISEYDGTYDVLLPDAIRDLLRETLKARHDRFRADVLAGKIRVFTTVTSYALKSPNSVQVTNQEENKAFFESEHPGADIWYLWYYWTAEELGLYQTYGDSWQKAGVSIPNVPPPSDVTDLFIKAATQLYSEQQKLREREAAHEAYLAATFSFDIGKPQKYNEDDDFEVLATVIVKASGKAYKYSARNIEDFGLAINPVPDGGLIWETVEGEWYLHHYKSAEGWFPSRILSDEEREVYQAVEEKLSQYSYTRM